jgi:hypothetical protein
MTQLVNTLFIVRKSLQFFFNKNATHFDDHLNDNEFRLVNKLKAYHTIIIILNITIIISLQQHNTTHTIIIMSLIQSSSRRMNFRTRKIDIEKPLPVVFTKTEDEQELSTLIKLNEKSSSSSSQKLSLNGSTPEEKFEDVPEISNEAPVTIPVPLVMVKENPDYVNVHFNQPRHYIRYYGGTFDEGNAPVHYDMDENDENYLENLNNKLQQQQNDSTSTADNSSNLNTDTNNSNVPDEVFEKSIDRFEKTTGFSKKLCALQDALQKFPELSTLTRPKIINQIYQYWKEKRLKRVFEYDKGIYKTCGRPLLDEFMVSTLTPHTMSQILICLSVTTRYG